MLWGAQEFSRDLRLTHVLAGFLTLLGDGLICEILYSESIIFIVIIIILSQGGPCLTSLRYQAQGLS
jgi:hypothetical protein